VKPWKPFEPTAMRSADEDSPHLFFGLSWIKISYAYICGMAGEF